MQREVGEVNKKVDAVSAEVEKTQQRVQQNEVRIDDVDKSAQAGIGEAKGSAAGRDDQGPGGREGRQGQAHLHRHPVERQGALPGEPGRDQRRGQDDDRRGGRAAREGQNRGVYFEIEGHTDSTGDAAYNFRLGEERAMAVRDYIAKTHGIALNRLNVISYGEDKPVADNKTNATAAPRTAGS